MTVHAINAPLDTPKTFTEVCWFEGNGSTSQTVYEGQGVCYNWDYGTASENTPARGNRVELPTILNARHFAGVLARNYTVPPDGTFVEINTPGSVCSVLSKASTTIGVGVLTCEAGGDYAGYFRYAGFEGAGSCAPLQTVDRSTTAGLCLAELQVGVQSGLVDVVDADTGGAITCMVGGMTILNATGTPGAHATFTMADGTIEGIKKGFKCIVDYGDTYDFVVTVNGLEMDGTALTTIVLDDINDASTLQWNGGDWCETGFSGRTAT
jgi:hypothetical protein